MFGEVFTYSSFFCGLGGLLVGSASVWLFFKIKIGSFDKLAFDVIQKADSEAESKKRSAEIIIKQNIIDQQREIEQTWQIERKKILREEERLKIKEDKLDSRLNLAERKINEIEAREQALQSKKAHLEEEKKGLILKTAELTEKLEKISGFSSAEAKEHLLANMTNEAKTEAANLIRRIKKETEEEAEKEASTIIATAISRLCVPCVSETTICTVPLPNDEMKGRIIGRDGRNVRTLEKVFGVNFIVDDTPGAVVISGFDPIRKHIAKTALQELILDGRIHPTRILEIYEKTCSQVQKQIRQFGEDAALRIGAMNIHPELMNLLGKLKFRFSYGQNVLEHSLEVAHLMGLMAAELGGDSRMAKRIGLLHDLGKAVSHEVEGSHAIIGKDLALKYGESKEVANGIGCHHGEEEAKTLEASLCAPSDAISASRPGARNEDVEQYFKRLKHLEEMAYQFPGVDKAYVLQAGREILIIVCPEKIDDVGTENLARDLTRKMEQELRYPGKIKVTVVREKRVVEYAV